MAAAPTVEDGGAPAEEEEAAVAGGGREEEGGVAREDAGADVDGVEDVPPLLPLVEVEVCDWDCCACEACCWWWCDCW